MNVAEYMYMYMYLIISLPYSLILLQTHKKEVKFGEVVLLS